MGPEGASGYSYRARHIRDPDFEASRVLEERRVCHQPSQRWHSAVGANQAEISHEPALGCGFYQVEVAPGLNLVA